MSNHNLIYIVIYINEVLDLYVYIYIVHKYLQIEKKNPIEHHIIKIIKVTTTKPKNCSKKKCKLKVHQ